MRRVQFHAIETSLPSHCRAMDELLDRPVNISTRHRLWSIKANLEDKVPQEADFPIASQALPAGGQSAYPGPTSTNKPWRLSPTVAELHNCQRSL
jgi:hypothetical protein